MKSLKTRLTVILCALTTIICSGLSITAFKQAKNAMESNLNQTLPKIAEQSARTIQGEIQARINSLESIAARSDISDVNISPEDKFQILAQEAKRIGSIRIRYVDKEGNATTSEGEPSLNVKDRDYFKKAISGTSSVSDPSVSKTSGNIVVMYAVPVRYNNEIIGILLDIEDGNQLSNLTDEVNYGKTGTAFMLNKKGITIAGEDRESVLQMKNAIEEAEEKPELKALAEIEKKMLTRENDLGEYEIGGVEKYIGYAPVNNTEWVIGVTIDKDEILSELKTLRTTAIIISIIFNIIGLIVVYIISAKISKGIKLTADHLQLLSEGDLSKEVPIDYLKSKDEIGDMTNAMKTMQESLSNMISKIKENSINTNSQSENLVAISEEMASVSQNVTEAISEVAKGTGNQSEELINITEILNEFSTKLSEMVKQIEIVDSTSKEIIKMANESSREMDSLNGSVESVSSSFKDFNNKITGLGEDIAKINEITNLINSIAEQTNLLALNAAIEAARAGESGKGFAVVADEIRKLAEQSKNSAENISVLIGGISQNTDVIVEDSVKMDEELINQIEIIDNSITSFKKIIDAVDGVIPKIKTVKSSAENIETDKNSIFTRIEGVSSISLEVSASAEEISASAEETNSSTEEVASAAQLLSNMTNEILEELNSFKIKKDK